MQDPEQAFMFSDSFAVAGASNHREKYGNIVFRALLDFVRDNFPNKTDVFPLNPNETAIEGHPAYKNLAALPRVPEALSIVTPPAVTRQVVDEAITAGVKRVWMQPGAEDAAAIEAAQKAGLAVIANGPCLLVAMKLR